MSDRRHKIDFIKRDSGTDDYGAPTNSWTPYKTGIWASKDPLLGKEYFAAFSIDSKVEVKFNCQYIPGITNDMRIQHGTEIYEILSAVNVKALNRELLCYCRKVK